MNDPYLSAWTTQYTNSPATATMSSTFEKTRPRRKARRSCMNCQRGHRTCDNQRPCEQCTKRGKQQTCIDGNHKQFKYLRDSEYQPTRRRRSREDTGEASEGSSPECIDPGLLHAQQSPAAEGNVVARLLREQSTCSSPCLQTVRDNQQAIQSGQLQQARLDEPRSPEEDVFEDILAELLAYDTTKPPSFLTMPAFDDHESKSNGFSISTGWSSTFFPPTECEVRLR
ncbi:hypothetical protein BJX68DRAFT_242582 [Aspergillus pseudodeflectus]|uniref:Transcription activator of gluconeogenesis acuK n=1 Tax=Aspergillus pseudodeflectus TaxID=176178 RepID=A0ABR4JYQ8_9EURO